MLHTKNVKYLCNFSVLFIDQVPAYSPILCLPRRPHVRFTPDRKAKQEHVLLGIKWKPRWLQQVFINSVHTLQRKYNGLGLPRRAGVCLLEDKSQSRRTPPLGTMAVVAAYHSVSPVPRHYHPSAFRHVMLWWAASQEHLTGLSFGTLMIAIFIRKTLLQVGVGEQTFSFRSVREFLQCM